MAIWQEEFPRWVQAWAALLDLTPQMTAGVATMGPSHVMVWPGKEASAQAALMDGSAELILVTEDPAGAVQFARDQGLRETSRAVLLRAETQNLDLVPRLPVDANLADAPLENYDVVEVALFDRPVASGRLRRAGDLAVVTAMDVEDEYQELRHTFELAIMAELGEEAFTHGAETLYLIAGAEQAERFAAIEGWGKAADILNFSR